MSQTSFASPVETYTQPDPSYIYTVYNRPDVRQDIFDASRAAVDYIEENAVSAVILLDTSARGLYKGIRRYWDRTHKPDEPAPDMYFIDPDGLSLYEGDEEQNRGLQVTQPQLTQKHPDNTVLVADTCLHTGATMHKAVLALQDNGFSDVRTGVVSPGNRHSHMWPTDLTMLDHEAFWVCHPFDFELLVEHNGEAAVSQRGGTKNIATRRRGNTSRDEIARIIDEGVAIQNAATDYRQQVNANLSEWSI